MYTPIRLLIISIVLSSSQSTSLFAQNLATVIRVIDGDTLKINYGDQEESIRLIGIDTPESQANPKAVESSNVFDRNESIHEQHLRTDLFYGYLGMQF